MSNKETSVKKQQSYAPLAGVRVRYFYNGEVTIDSCSNCGSNNINTYTSDWLRMEGMNRKECQNCEYYWLVNAR